jgi:2,4-dienoyl-CoA reductase-like NADH-dependent reductase (Old Yellow Enzyme family)
LIFAEAAAVEERGRITHGDLGIYSDAHVPGLKRITDFIRSQGCLSAMQIAHAGRKGSMQRPWYGNGPLVDEDFRRGDQPWSIVAHGNNPIGEGWLIPHELSSVELVQVRDAFSAAARRAHLAGFDVLELHSAHGYLLHGFLSPLSNFRTDRYGGDRAGRMRFPLEVAAGVRAEWPADKPLMVRISSIDDVEGGWGIEDSVAYAAELKRLGVDLIDCSSGGIFGSATAATRSLTPRVPGFQLPFAERIRREAEIATMAVGMILTGSQAEQALQAGRADLIAIGREALYNPRWAQHAAQELGIDADFALWPQQYGWWLTRRTPWLERSGVKRGGIALAPTA